MKCPSCRSIESNRITLITDLNALVCVKCEGLWIRAEQYWHWKKKQSETFPERPDVNISELDLEDSGTAKICPECSKILIRYEVGHSTGFSLDRCNICGGTWFDKNEWEALREKNLHDEIHFIFSAPWQSEVRKEKQEQLMEKRVEKILGSKDYIEAKRVKSWIANHQKSAEILAYLQKN